MIWEIGGGSCFSNGVPTINFRDEIVQLILSEYRREWLEYKGRDSGMTEEMDGTFIENGLSIFTIGNTIY